MLKTCHGEAVRTLAFKLLPEKNYTANAICMLITNYCKNDREALLKALYRLPVTYSNTSSWHGVMPIFFGPSDKRRIRHTQGSSCITYIKILFALVVVKMQ